MLNQIVLQAPVFLLIAVRCFALLMTLPLFSMRSVSRMAKVALAGYMAYLIIPHFNYSEYQTFIGNDGAFSLIYILLVIGEGLIGLIIGFYVNVIFSAFSTAGQFFAFQMGFSAASSYDALSQVENPLMGQFFNLVAMLIFLQNQWGQRLFGGALVSSFDTLNVFSLIEGREHLFKFLLSGLTELFADAFVIALPIMGTLLLINITMGILSKAAPQMNLLSEGFPIMILLSFFMITVLIYPLCNYFVGSFAKGFANLQDLFIHLRR